MYRLLSWPSSVSGRVPPPSNANANGGVLEPLLADLITYVRRQKTAILVLRQAEEVQNIDLIQQLTSEGGLLWEPHAQSCQHAMRSELQHGTSRR